MTKRQLLKWLEEKEAEALNNAKQHYLLAKEVHKEQLYAELELIPLASKIQEYANKADDLMRAWKEKYKNKVEMVSNYGDVSTKLSNLVESPNTTFKRIIEYDFRDNTPEMLALDGEYKKVKDEIKKNYANVSANIQNLKDAKTGMQYLQELGFDLAALIQADEKPISTALSVAIDTRYLFLGGGQ
jgi:hypothetical protein